ARLSDSAVEHHDHLWRARRRLDPEAVHRRSPAGPAAGGDFHGLGNAAHHPEPDAGAGGRGEARAGPLARTLRRAEGPRTGLVSERPWPIALHADRRADRLLPCPRLFPRWLFDDRDDVADRAADREGRGL